jgi:aminoglycoside phosphotransferase (APT) family kinase protein
VPLPEILAADLDYEFPYLILERLQGVDLGVVVGTLATSSLAHVATKVAAAQSVVSKLPSAGRYGFAVSAQEAPHERWSDVLRDNLDRSRKRIELVGLFDSSPVDAMEVLVAAQSDALDGLPSTPFLHDTTTKNVIVTEAGRFSGIVDVDDLCFGDPRYVVALTLASLLASAGPVSYVDAWVTKASFRDDYLFRLYVALFIVDFMSEHGQRFNGNQIQSSEDIRERLRRVFSDCLARIEAAR